MIRHTSEEEKKEVCIEILELEGTKAKLLLKSTGDIAYSVNLDMYANFVEKAVRNCIIVEKGKLAFQSLAVVFGHSNTRNRAYHEYQNQKIVTKQ